MKKLLRIAGKAALGAAGGALAMIAIGQVVGLFAESCTVVCQPAFAARLGALAGAVAVFTIQPYQPG